MSTRGSQGRRLVQEQLAELSGRGIHELARLVDTPQVRVQRIGDGVPHRVRIYAFWDIEEWDSSLYVHVKVYGRGLRRIKPYFGCLVLDPDGGELP
ncbi:MAG: hypothetical protein WD844_14405 [Thermoleophilaceae bacterium]